MRRHRSEHSLVPFGDRLAQQAQHFREEALKAAPPRSGTACFARRGRLRPQHMSMNGCPRRGYSHRIDGWNINHFPRWF